MTKVDLVEIPLGDGSSANSVRRALQRQQDAIQQAIAAFERAELPFSITLTQNGIRRMAGDAQGACTVLEGLLADFDPETERLQSVTALWVHGQDETKVMLALAEHEVVSDPAGVVLLERTMSNDPNGASSEEVIADIRKTLADHAMARADSEYAVEIAMPVQDDDHSSTALLRGLALAPSIVAVLPTELPGRPNVMEMRVRLRESIDQPLLRIWRLGFMKVAGRTRVV